MILVDDRPTSGKFGWDWYHMATDNLAADGLDELHAMADRLGLQRRWMHNHPGIPHYDVPADKKLEAIRLGAQEVSARELVRRCRRRHRRPVHDSAGTLTPDSQ
jgi:hypothetical protein